MKNHFVKDFLSDKKIKNNYTDKHFYKKDKRENIVKISYGILAFSKDYKESYNRETLKIIENYENNEKFRLLLIQRKHTMGYNDFIRGKYELKNIDMVKRYLIEMTKEERHKIKIYSFNYLWSELWDDKSSFKKKSYYKYKKLNIIKLLEETEKDNIYTYTEFGIPKGKKNKNETELDCAKREFEEETDYSLNDIDILDIEPCIEEFTATNNIKYKHIYYFALMKPNFKKPGLNIFNSKQHEEVRNLDFFYLKDCINILRHYDVEKIKIIEKSFEIIEKYVK